INSDLANDREVTSWPSLKQDLLNAGARWQDAEVVVDGNLITSRKPDDIPAFSEAVVRALAA
ncbi:DJ-1/PfpI family protein, partial [Enterobacter hormaechei]|uniref:DJ-1/PfpI family protein n=1 Tax=Enterobacter hormaechei TaxID=158836 RepID=UPI00203B2BC9